MNSFDNLTHLMKMNVNDFYIFFYKDNSIENLIFFLWFIYFVHTDALILKFKKLAVK